MATPKAVVVRLCNRLPSPPASTMAQVFPRWRICLCRFRDSICPLQWDDWSRATRLNCRDVKCNRRAHPLPGNACRATRWSFQAARDLCVKPRLRRSAVGAVTSRTNIAFGVDSFVPYLTVSHSRLVDPAKNFPERLRQLCRAASRCGPSP